MSVAAAGSCLKKRWEKALGEGLGVWVTCLQVLASLQTFCVALGMTAPLQLPLCLVTSRSSTPERQGRGESCDNSVGGDELQKWCWRRGQVSISAALQLPGDGDWKAVPIRLPSCSKSTLPSLLFPYWATFQSLYCPKQVSLHPNALKSIFLKRHKSYWKPLWLVIITTWTNNWF